PSVSLTNPVDGAVFFQPVTLTLQASASDTDGSVVRVEFYAGTTKLGQSVTNPYSATWTNPALGYYRLTAVATDDSGLMTTSAPVNVSIQNAIVQLTSPTNGARFISPDPVSITANASDSGGAVTLVQFFDGATKLGQTNARPFTSSWNSVPGTHTFPAVATAGANSSTSAPVQINVLTNMPP